MSDHGPEFRADLFRGTADYYARCRPAYPAALLDDLRQRAGITGDGELLDLACGTGEVALPLAPFFRRVRAVDQEREMVDRGRAKAAGIDNVTWEVGRAEDLDVPAASLELVTVGNAFHRLDRRLVARRALRWLRPGGCFALLNATGLWSGTQEWQRVAVEVIKKWKVAGTGPAGPRSPESHMEALRAAGFVRLEEHVFPTPLTWTVEDFIGYLFSSAAASRTVFGGAVEEFEADLRRALAAHERGGRLHETNDFHYILAGLVALR